MAGQVLRATIGRSAGVAVEPMSFTGAAETLGTPIRGSAEEIADGFRLFRADGFTQLEVMLWPPTLAALEALAPCYRAPRRRLTTTGAVAPPLPAT